MQSDPAASTIAGTYNIPATSSPALEAKQRPGAAPVGQGTHAPGKAAPPPPAAGAKTLDPQTVADRLVDEAERKNPSDTMRRFRNLSDTYRRAGDPTNPKIRTDVQKAMLANPAFKQVIDAAAKIVIGGALKESDSPTDPTRSGDRGMWALVEQIKGCHSDVAAMFVVSATPLFVQHGKDKNGAIFRFNDQIQPTMPGDRKGVTYLSVVKLQVGSNSEALAAIKRLEALTETPSP